MITAKHKKSSILIYDLYINKILKKDFHSFIAVNEYPEIPENAGLLITPNHLSWWDGFFIDYIMKKYDSKKIHLMMLEEQLKKYWFFKNVGAFSINPNNAKSIYESFVYSKEILKNPKNYLVIYPQGEIEQYDKEEYTIRKGIKNLIEGFKGNAFVLPLTFKINYENERKPSVYFRFGELLNFDLIKNDFSIFENEFRNGKYLLNESIDKKIITRNLFDD